jgi:addiction module HigA family antidote
MSDEPVPHPGVFLKQRFLDPLGITVDTLARDLDLRRRTVADLLAGKRPLDADMATRLGLYFEVPARWWLEMQARFDAADHERQTELRGAVRPYAGLAEVLVTPTGVRRLASSPAGTPQPPVVVSADLVARLQAQARHGQRRLRREPTIVPNRDGTPTLTGR